MNQRLKNAFKHRFRSLQHFVVPEPDHAKPEPREILRAFKFIQQMLVVLASIYFHDQTRPVAHEIRDVRPERNLPAESIATQVTIANEMPQQSFGIGCVAA